MGQVSVKKNTYGIGIDLYESMIQKVYEDAPGDSMVPFIWNINEIADLFKYTFKGVVTKAAKKVPKEVIVEYASKASKTLAKKAVSVYNKKYEKKFTQEQIELMFNEVFDYLIDESIGAYASASEEEILAEESADVATHVLKYKESILNGHGVIVVAHSQGNLFINRAYNEFGKFANINHDKWMKNYMNAIGVATPANNILDASSPYITFDNDMIQVVPDSLPTNVINLKRYYFTNATGEEIETLFSVEAHNFLSSYMKTDETRNTILSFIDSSITKHNAAPSQWELDQELNKNTKDYRITVKHRFDSSIIAMNGIKVYPFAPSKKLYYIQGKFSENISGYVKASCGGTKILASWTGQQDSEAYYLDGTGEIINVDTVPVIFEMSFRYEYNDISYVRYAVYTMNPLSLNLIDKGWSYSSSSYYPYSTYRDVANLLSQDMSSSNVSKLIDILSRTYPQIKNIFASNKQFIILVGLSGRAISLIIENGLANRFITGYEYYSSFNTNVNYINSYNQYYTNYTNYMNSL